MVAQGPGTLLAGALHPLSDDAFADAECFDDLALGPIPLREGPGVESSGFLPMGRCRVQTWESTTIKSLGLWFFMAGSVGAAAHDLRYHTGRR
jgi:hypothetical protein